MILGVSPDVPCCSAPCLPRDLESRPLGGPLRAFGSPPRPVLAVRSFHRTRLGRGRPRGRDRVNWLTRTSEPERGSVSRGGFAGSSVLSCQAGTGTDPAQRGTPVSDQARRSASLVAAGVGRPGPKSDPTTGHDEGESGDLAERFPRVRRGNRTGHMGPLLGLGVSTSYGRRHARRSQGERVESHEERGGHVRRDPEGEDPASASLGA